MKPLLILAFITLASAASAQSSQTFTGTITDSECANADHSLMRMGDTSADCVNACVDSHGATYLLFDGKVAYALSDQKSPAKFAAKKVTVTGTLDAKTKTIHVESIVAAP
jgi:hypothetical protein